MERVRRVGSLAAVALFVCASGATAQDSLDWLTGAWTERRQSKERILTPATVEITATDSMLRIVDGGFDGNDWQCRLDGTETRSRQVKSKATLDYALKCKVTSNSPEAALSGFGFDSGAT